MNHVSFLIYYTIFSILFVNSVFYWCSSIINFGLVGIISLLSIIVTLWSSVIIFGNYLVIPAFFLYILIPLMNKYEI